MATIDTDHAPDGRTPSPPLIIFRAVSREQRLRSLLKPTRPKNKLPGR